MPDRSWLTGSFRTPLIFRYHLLLRKLPREGGGGDSNRYTWLEKIDAIMKYEWGILEHFYRDHQIPVFWDLRTSHPWLMCPDPRMHIHRRWIIATAISRNLGFPRNKSSAHLTHMAHKRIKYWMPLQSRPNLSKHNHSTPPPGSGHIVQGWRVLGT